MMETETPSGFSGLSDFTDWDKLSVNERRPRGVMLQAAHVYLGRLPWIDRCIGFWKGFVCPDLVGVFLYRIVPLKPEVPEYHWIVVGPKYPHADWDGKTDWNEVRNQTYSGLPHAYIWTGYPDFSDKDAAPDPMAALESYCNVIEDWIIAVRTNGDLSSVFPVELPKKKSAIEYANDIDPLIERVREIIVHHNEVEMKP